MNFIIESIGKNGVKTTSAHNGRLARPTAGDIVDFGEGERPYPYTNVRYGRVDRIRDDGKVSICCQTQRVFLEDDGSVSITGGPFQSVALEDLEPTHTLDNAPFWNWGNHSPGAHQGVDYTIARPVFRLTIR